MFTDYFAARLIRSGHCYKKSLCLLGSVAVACAIFLTLTCSVQAQSPGGNLGALLTRLQADEANITALQNSNQALQNTVNQMAASGVIPTGLAGGDLTGTYPSPTIAAKAIDSSKLALDQASLGYVSGGKVTVQNDGDIAINEGNFFCLAAFDDFTYQNYTVGNYSLGWFQDSADGAGPSAWLSGWGGIKLFTATAPRLTITSGGNVGIGTTSPQNMLDVAGGINATSMQINGGSDLAEPYRITPGNVKPLPGMVVAIDPQRPGYMRVSTHAYDALAGGIVSGANGIRPGITLRQSGTIADGALPVASAGRVWCRCDAQANGPIKAGDLLTTSSTPGHAMRVTDYSKARGAIIGKAMSSLKTGKGLVLVLVSLQ